MQILQPKHWVQPRGYSNGVLSEGRLVFVAGQIGWNAEAELVSNDFVEQTRQALSNITAVLAEAGATPSQITRLTWYVVNKQQYLRVAHEVGAVYREIIGAHYPAMSLVVVADLLEDGALVEIEATAVIPL